MSTSPRKRPASEALVAGGGVILLIAIVGIVLLSSAGSALYPPKPATTQARGRQRPLRHRVRARRRDLRRGRGADRLEHPALPAQARRRRAAGADPRQQHGRGHLDAHPDGHRPVPVRDLVEHPQHRRRDQRPAGDPHPRPRGPVPVAVRVPRRERQEGRDADDPARSRTVAGWPSRSARRST